ncbi:MAG: CopG family transcriptional regulator [Nitrospirae bacterium RBG_13_39_12]|nr:MAG: CopG family transcriptional regulator [Nitrospirae bacterium RBG_13_39_12]
MGKTKIAITLDEQYIDQLDTFVSKRIFQNRSQAIQEAVKEKLARIKRTRLAKECAKLDPTFEKAIADEGLTGDLSQWPEY